MLLELGRLVELGHDFFAVVGSDDDSIYGGFGANQAFVLLEDSVLLFDSGFSLPHATHLLKKIKEVTSKKIRYLLNSHDHSDHVFGNSFFWKKCSQEGIRIVSHEICRANLESKGHERLTNYRKIPGMIKPLSPIQIRSANVTYPDIGLRLEIEGTEVVMSHPPTGAHTLGDTMLFFPKRGVAFAGDIVWNRFLPNLEDANLEGWISYLQDLDLATYQKIVPGHGEVCLRKRTLEFRDYLEKVQENLLELGQAKELPSERSVLRACFEIPGSETWKFRQIVDHNVDALLTRKAVN